MSKYTWYITLNKYDTSGENFKLVRADSCDIYENTIKFYNSPEKTTDKPYPEAVLIAYLPIDRVFEIELLDDETGEGIGFLPEGE
jgi:hypothetical protein